MTPFGASSNEIYMLSKCVFFHLVLRKLAQACRKPAAIRASWRKLAQTWRKPGASLRKPAQACANLRKLVKACASLRPTFLACAGPAFGVHVQCGRFVRLFESQRSTLYSNIVPWGILMPATMIQRRKCLLLGPSGPAQGARGLRHSKCYSGNFI